MASETQAQGGAGAQTLEGGSLLDDILSETKMAPGDEGYEVVRWNGRNLYFGGASVVGLGADGGLEAAGDPRRGGAGAVVR